MDNKFYDDHAHALRGFYKVFPGGSLADDAHTIKYKYKLHGWMSRKDR